MSALETKAVPVPVPDDDEEGDPHWTDEGEGASESYASDTDDDGGDEAPTVDHGDSTDEPPPTGGGPKGGMMTVRAHNRSTGEVVLLRAPRGTPMSKILEIYKQKTGLAEKGAPRRGPSPARGAARDGSPPRAGGRRTCPRSPVDAQLVTGDGEEEDEYPACWDPSCFALVVDDDGEGGVVAAEARVEPTDDDASCVFDWSQLSCF